MSARTKGCEKPDQLRAKPPECSAEQIQKCHGVVRGHPCVDAADCEHLEKLKGRKPGECSREQIRECHGDVAEHPCV
jgi:hypothetical protein